MFVHLKKISIAARSYVGLRQPKLATSKAQIDAAVHELSVKERVAKHVGRDNLTDDDSEQGNEGEFLR